MGGEVVLTPRGFSATAGNMGFIVPNNKLCSSFDIDLFDTCQVSLIRYETAMVGVCVYLLFGVRVFVWCACFLFGVRVFCLVCVYFVWCACILFGVRVFTFLFGVRIFCIAIDS